MSAMILREENGSKRKFLPNILPSVQEFSEFEGKRNFINLSYHLKLLPVLIPVDTPYRN